MLFIDNDSTESKIFNLLAKKPGLSAKQIFEKVVNKKRKFTYQAIYKALKKLVQDGIIKNNKRKYSLNMNLLKKIKQKIIQLETAQQEKNIKTGKTQTYS